VEESVLDKVFSDGINDFYTAIIENISLLEDMGLKPSPGALLIMATEGDEPLDNLISSGVVFEFAVKAGTPWAIVSSIAHGSHFENGFSINDTTSTIIKGWITSEGLIDLGNDCVHCGECTAFGQGKFVNRIPFGSNELEGYVCEPCQEGGEE